MLFTEKVDDGVNSCIECSQGESCGFDRQRSEGSVQPEKGVVNGGTCLMLKRNNFFSGVLE